MTPVPKRIQLISGRGQIDAIEVAAKQNSLETQRVELPKTDQRFGLAEVAAIVAIVHSLAEITDLVLKALNENKRKSAITIKSPTATITIEGDLSTSAADVMKQLEGTGLL